MKSVFSLGSFLGHELISSAWELNSGDTLPGPCVQVYLDVVLEPSPLSLITPPPSVCFPHLPVGFGTFKDLSLPWGIIYKDLTHLSYSGDFWELPRASVMWGKVPKVRLAVGIVLDFGMFSWVSQGGVRPEGGYAEILSQCRHREDGWD